jgi:hypothetical protein
LILKDEIELCGTIMHYENACGTGRATGSLRWMTCPYGFVKWKNRAARLARRKNSKERREDDLTTGFPEFANPADIVICDG